MRPDTVRCRVRGRADLDGFLEGFLLRRPWWLRALLRLRRAPARALGVDRTEAPAPTVDCYGAGAPAPAVSWRSERIWIFERTEVRPGELWAGQAETPHFLSRIEVECALIDPVAGRRAFVVVSRIVPATRRGRLWLSLLRPLRRALVCALAREAARGRGAARGPRGRAR